MQANTIIMNKVRSAVALTIQNRIGSIEATSVSVPLENIFGSQLLVQYRPENEYMNVVPNSNN